jgi:hypothetical protein
MQNKERNFKFRKLEKQTFSLSGNNFEIMKISNFSSSSQRKFFSHLSYSIFLLLNFFPIEMLAN